MSDQNAISATIMILIVLVVMGIIVMIGYNAFDETYDDVYNEFTSQDSKDVLDETHDRYPSVFDGLFVFAFVLLWSLGIVSVLVRDDHPIIFAFMMILLVFVVFAGVLIGNAFEEVFQDSTLLSLTTTFPKTYWILTHMLPIGIVVGFSILLINLAKNRL